ncbi:DUF4907 domain-containing protein [Flavobacterium psychrotolerans]|uniref:DUF4907 domain-containing protein n=1 Tax=Flavobacterium psychrotolerans TaxID=2169410 RepID=A0A2U1JL63_9FLAO|nr:DUF4907 domain-containing protein [Flavobacterium psychrotolerans]PWA05907.1 hypothetical protein DB895_05655 [Flavobacterium psychrotolerans]
MKKQFITVLLLCSLTFLNAQTAEKAAFPIIGIAQNNSINAKTIPSINATWGYEITVGNKIIIHQPNIPGMPGNEGFKTEKAAKKTAEFIIGKMNKGEMPPSITLEELKKIKTL